jgi:hypothetical protein
MNDKLSINNEMRQVDTKNRAFYDELTDEERKKFSTYLMLRYSSSVTSGPVELQKYYVQSCNEQMNKHFFSLELLFMCLHKYFLVEGFTQRPVLGDRTLPGEHLDRLDKVLRTLLHVFFDVFFEVLRILRNILRAR